jgi:hypothetical protein
MKEKMLEKYKNKGKKPRPRDIFNANYNDNKSSVITGNGEELYDFKSTNYDQEN